MRFRLRIGLGTRFGVLLLDILACLVVGALAAIVNFTFVNSMYVRIYRQRFEIGDIWPCLLVLVSVLFFVWGIAFVSERVFAGSIGMRLLCLGCRMTGTARRRIRALAGTSRCELRVLSKLTGHKPIWRQDIIRAAAPIPLSALVFGAILLRPGKDDPHVVSYIVFLVGSLWISALQLFAAAANDRRESIFDRFSQTVATRSRKKQPLEVKAARPFPSPYVVGQPIRDTRLFVGREEELGLLKDTLSKMYKGAIIVLAGAPRSGKSSLMEHIVTQHAALAKGDEFWDRVIPILQSLAATPVGGDVEFYGLLTDKLLRVLPGGPKASAGNPSGDERTSLDFAAIDKAQRAFTEALNRVLAAYPEKTLLLMLDEAQLLEMRVKEQRMTTGVIPYLAFLKAEQPRLSIVVAGPWDLKNQRFTYLDTLLVKAGIVFTLGRLSDAAAINLITEPVKGHVTYTPHAIQYILCLTGNHPFYIQLLCNELVWRLGEKDGITLEDVEAVAESVSATPPPMLPIFWAEASPQDRAVLGALARISFDEEDYASPDEVRRQLRRRRLNFVLADHEIPSILGDLVRRNILTIQKGRGYTFQVDLLRMWIRANHLVS